MAKPTAVQCVREAAARVHRDVAGGPFDADDVEALCRAVQRLCTYTEELERFYVRAGNEGDAAKAERDQIAHALDELRANFAKREEALRLFPRKCPACGFKHSVLERLPGAN